MDCPNCRTTNPEGAKYCVHCGTPLTVGLRRGVGTREVTCLSIYVKGFGKLEGLIPRLKISELREVYLETIDRNVTYFGGTVVKRYGAGADAVFGAPITWERDTELAVLAAIAIKDDTADFSDKVLSEYGVTLTTRCGIDVGLITYENVPGESTLTAAGPTLEYAARLRNAARPNGILVSHSAYDFVRNYFVFRPYVFTGSDAVETPVTSYVVQRRKPTGVPIQMLARGPFVSRENELTRLTSVIETGTSERASATLVLGEPGMGKTRVVVEAINKAGFGNVFWTRYLPRSNFLPYLPYRQFLTDLFDAKPGKELLERIREFFAEKDNALVRYLPLLGLIFDRDFGRIPDEEAIPEDDKRGLLYDLVFKIAEAAAAERPFVLVLENVHWADPASMDLTRFLLHRFKNENLPVAVIITSRETGHSKGISYDDVIYLKPLNAIEIAAIGRRIIHEDRWDEQVKDEIIKLAQGNPIYAEEFARAIAIKRPGEKTVIPPVVRIGIQARLDRLSDESLSLIKLATCVGESFPVNLLNELSGLAPADYFGALYELLQEKLIYIKEDKVRIKSTITSEIIEQELLEGYKTQIHGDIAENYRARGGDPLIVARHLVSAGRKTEAGRFLIESGDDAGKNVRYDDALRYYLAAIDLLGGKKTADDGQEDVIRKTVTIYVELGRIEKALELLKREFERSTTAESKAGYLSLVGNVYKAAGRPETALEYLSDAEALYKRLGDEKQAVERGVDKGFCYFKLNRLNEAEAYAKANLDKLAETDDVQNKVSSYYLLALVSFERGDTNGAVDYVNKAYEMWDKLGNTQGCISTYNLVGLALQDRGKITNAETYFKKSVELAETLEAPRAYSAVVGNYAHLLTCAGKIREAIKLLTVKALPLAREVDYKDVLGAANSVLSFAYFAAGEFIRAEETGCEALGYAEEIGSPERILKSLRRVYTAKLGAGATDVTPEIEKLENLGATWTSRPNAIARALWEIRARLALNTGDRARAGELLETVETVPSDGRDVLGNYEKRILTGELYEFLANAEAAEADYSYVYNDSRGNGAFYYAGTAAYGLVRLSLKSGDKEAAEKYLTTLESTFGGQNLEYWEDVIRSLKDELNTA
ncbi:MAG: AAA family ATPase [Candidatus Coatesbacteria bacterium]|nr:MAG: AAA family ATPase [Candidatus Coatesbacteria bacterium]